MLLNVAHERGFNCRKVEAATAEMRMRACQLDRHTSLCRSHVNYGFEIAPGKLPRERLGGNQASSAHAVQEDFLSGGILIKRRIAAVTKRAALRSTRPQRLCQRVPVQ